MKCGDGTVAKLKSGLRASHLPFRVTTAENIVGDVLSSAPFAGHYTLQNRTFAKYSAFGGFETRFPSMLGGYHMVDPVDSDGKVASGGGFEIHHKSKPIGVVEVWNMGKPVVHIHPEHKALGRAISTAFKKHAKYWFSPKVALKSQIGNVNSILAPKEGEVHARSRRFSDEISDRVSQREAREEEALRMQRARFKLK